MFKLAKRCNRASLWLFYLSVLVFLLAGSVSAWYAGQEAHIGQAALLDMLVTRVPVWLMYASVPLSVLCAWLLARLGILNRSIAITIFLICFAMTAAFKVFGISSWLAAGAWVGVVYMLKANIARFEKYLAERKHPAPSL